MATFESKCPLCGTGFQAEDEWIGQTGECPSCGKEIKIQAPEKSISQAPVIQKEQEVPVSDDKTCPFCGELIKIGATKCKHCQSVLNEKEEVNQATSHKSAKILTEEVIPSKNNNKRIVVIIGLVVLVLLGMLICVPTIWSKYDTARKERESRRQEAQKQEQLLKWEADNKAIIINLASEASAFFNSKEYVKAGVKLDMLFSVIGDRKLQDTALVSIVGQAVSQRKIVQEISNKESRKITGECYIMTKGGSRVNLQATVALIKVNTETLTAKYIINSTVMTLATISQTLLETCELIKKNKPQADVDKFSNIRIWAIFSYTDEGRKALSNLMEQYKTLYQQFLDNQKLFVQNMMKNSKSSIEDGSFLLDDIPEGEYILYVIAGYRSDALVWVTPINKKEGSPLSFKFNHENARSFREFNME
jgi:flagellar basal body-associated protein FliL